MKRSIKVTSFFVIILLFTSIIAGCGSSSSKRQNTPAASSKTTQTNTQNTPATSSKTTQTNTEEKITVTPNPIPEDKPISSGNVYVRGYYRKDGTYVQPHYRTKPDGYKSNNWSTKGNYNPYTGKKGYK